MSILSSIMHTLSGERASVFELNEICSQPGEDFLSQRPLEIINDIGAKAPIPTEPLAERCSQPYGDYLSPMSLEMMGYIGDKVLIPTYSQPNEGFLSQKSAIRGHLGTKVLTPTKHSQPVEDFPSQMSFEMMGY